MNTKNTTRVATRTAPTSTSTKVPVKAATRPAASRPTSRPSAPVYREDALKRILGPNFTVTTTSRSNFNVALTGDALKSCGNNDWKKVQLILSAMKLLKEKHGYTLDPNESFKFQNIRDGRWAPWLHFFVNRPESQAEGAGNAVASAKAAKAEAQADQLRRGMALLLKMQKRGADEEVLRDIALSYGIDYDNPDATPETAEVEEELEEQVEEGEVQEEESSELDLNMGEEDEIVEEEVEEDIPG